jgi:hypothetical protein
MTFAYRNYQHSVDFHVVLEEEGAIYEDHVAIRFILPSSQRFKLNEFAVLEISYAPGWTPSLETKVLLTREGSESVAHESVRSMSSFESVLVKICGDGTVRYQSPAMDSEEYCSAV